MHARSRWQPGKTLTAGLWCAVLLGGFVSCTYLPREGSTEKPKAQLLKGEELPLYMTRLGQNSRRVVTAAPRILVRPYFDPELVDVRKVEKYRVWVLEEGRSTWKSIGEAAPENIPIPADLPEGIHGLRASAVIVGGHEKLLPQAGDEPALWLCVDRTPPSLVWLEPRENTAIHEKRSLELRWAANEVQFGDTPSRLEWSSDHGQTWKKIDTVPAGEGHQSYTWRLPKEICSDIVLRVVSRDLAGHEASASVTLAFPGSLDSGAPQLASAGAKTEPESSPSAEDAGGEPTPAVATEAEAGRPAPSAAETQEDLAAEALPSRTAPPPAKESSAGAAAAVGAGASVATRAPGEAGVQLAEESAEKVAPSRESTGGLRLDAFESSFLKGGERKTISWCWEGPPREGTAFLEWSMDQGGTWSTLGSAPLADGRIDWNVPAESGAGYSLRIRAELKEGGSIEAELDKPFSVDADPPVLVGADLPVAAGAQLKVPLAPSDPGGSGLARVDAYLRPAGTEAWGRLSENKVRLQGSNVHLDLSDEKEGEYEIFFSALDRAGNASASPFDPRSASPTQTPSARPWGKFRLDRTPPAIAARAGPGDWVGGARLEAQVDVDWTDAVPPLAVEGRASGEAWVDMGRWTSVAPGQNSFGIDLPGGSGAKEYSVRFSVADAAGNKAFAVVGPHELRSPITLGSFTATKSYLEGAGEKIRWQLHPAMSEAGDSLRVSVAHLPRKDGEWVQIYGDLQPSSECYWELPAAGGEEHRLRVRLLKGGKVIGEDISPPFSVAARDLTAPTVVKVSEESLFISNQARAKAETYYAAVAAGESASSSAELEKLAAEISGGFQKALEIDKNNHAATYGMAQFLNRADSVRNAQEVQRWLLRTIEIKPDHAWALNDLGALHIRAGDFKAAEEALRRSAAIKPSPIILYNLGIALFYGGSVREAREKLESALKEDTMQSLPRGEICCYLIQAHIQEGNLQEARALFKENESAIPPDLREGLVKSIGQ